MALSDGYSYNKAGVNANAPTYAGVYGLFRKDNWIYFGEAINIRDRLIQHLDTDAEENPDIVRENPTGFCFESVEGGKTARVARQDQLILQYRNHPLCNRKLG